MNLRNAWTGRESCSIASAATGGIVWLVWTLVVFPTPFETPWAASLLLLAVLVLTPLGIRLAGRGSSEVWSTRRLASARRLQLPAALALAASLSLPAGPIAGTLAIPWLAVTFLIAAAGVVRLWRRRLGRADQLCIDLGLAYLAVGGIWTVISRFGLRPLGFEAVIVLLTAIHFHYAGFALPILTGSAARRFRDRWSRFFCLLVGAAVPMVAVGITMTQLGWSPVVEAVSAAVLSLAGVSTAVLHFRLAIQTRYSTMVRVLWGLVGASLIFAMSLSALYGSRSFLDVAWLDIPWMRALHGSANALGFGLAGLLAWNLLEQTDDPTS